jgi:hypothetical protein
MGAAAVGATGAAVAAWRVFRARSGVAAAAVGAVPASDSHVALTHRPAGAVATNLRRLRALALAPDGRLYVAGDQTICVYAPGADGVPGPLSSQIDPQGVATCLAAADDGRLFVGVDGQIAGFAADGGRVATWAIPEGEAILTSLAVLPDGILAADAAGRRVWRFDNSGTCTGAIGGPARDGSSDGFIVPSPFFDVAVDGDGTVWVGNPGRHRVERYSADGAFQGAWGTFGAEAAEFCGCCNPSYVTLYPPGNGGPAGLLTSEKGIPRVKLYDLQGNLRGVVAGPEQLAGESQGLDVVAAPRDPRTPGTGRVFVLAPRARKVLIFEATG